MTTSAELREKFLKYFESHGHTIVPSSPLVPANDPTLLFTNSGMVQFKDVFLGTDKRSYTRATTSQRCVRAGGKHNDLENVGYTARHHTFFEMLGNFSFGEYFKKEAINYAWDFLTNVIGLPAEKLWVTVYAEDDEAADIWLKEIKVDPERFTRIGTSDNFWSMGDTGPCGPCSEIFYDHGPEVEGGPPGTPEEDGDRYIEIWNLVFMQFNRDASGNMEPLPRPSVDTGMGLERLAAILQNVHNNYDIDLFKSLIAATAELTDTEDLEDKSLRVIADHIRSCAFLIVDGVLPSNEGRGYVLRRIIRRAARHGHHLGCKQPFFYRLVAALDQEMGDAYPELRKHRGHVERVLQKEEQRFAETLEQGMRILEDAVATMDGDTIDGKTVFKLYDTYGFPVDLTADVAREKNLEIDQAGFDVEMEKQRSRARASSQFSAVGDDFKLDAYPATEFLGYEQARAEAVVIAILQNDESIDQLENGDQAIVILECTPFYAESGGQVGDIGSLSIGEENLFRVTDTQKQNDVFLHIGSLISGELSTGDRVEASIDEDYRRAVMLNHSATHLMHAALRQVLGEHVQQKGSLVDSEKLRFDFSHYQPLEPDQIAEIETLVNNQIRGNLETRAELMDMGTAKNAGAIALFGEKYGDVVRVLRIGSDSIELCGGTHVPRAGDIGLFKIVFESGIASGIRRIEAVTGEAAVKRFIDSENRLEVAAQKLKSSREELLPRIEQLQASNRSLEKQLEALKSRLASQTGGDLASQAQDVKGIKVLAANLDGANVKTLRETVDQLKNKLGAAAVVLASSEDGKVSIIAGVTKPESERIPAGDLANMVAEQCGGRGGGRPDMAQAGGNQPENLSSALDSVLPWVENRL
ncbi:MAG: alanine--tRNA ligase [Gammaproteobacteria bacterium]|nr:MAG: alanine--tRNA ligase [Gammaproteobacteria bacterium]UCH39029.1 MAG: alanine--tRNA ligase [Gammaproteobacteria bacterium]